ncbi:hypothetical protein PIIN_10723, partial [Serendipita indica DSM 11827]
MASNGAPTTSPSDSASFSTLPPFGVSTSTIKGSVQNTQGPGVAPTPPQSSNNSGRASVIVGSVLGTASVLAGALILFLYLRRRPRRKSPRQAKTTKATTVHPSITPFYDEDALESASPRNEAPTIPSKDQKQPLPTPASPGPSAVVFGEKGGSEFGLVMGPELGHRGKVQCNSILFRRPPMLYVASIAGDLYRRDRCAGAVALTRAQPVKAIESGHSESRNGTPNYIMSVSRSHYYEGQEGRGLQCSHGRSLKVREIFLTPVKYLQLSFVTYMTDYDKFQSTINLAHTDGGPWMCGANSSCYIGSRPTDSTTINYLLFGGTLVAVLKVRPELARPRQIMSYKWQYRACASSPGAARQLVTTIGTSTTSSAIPVCPDAGYTLIKTGDFTIGGDGTFSISISAGYGQISAYMIGMSFSMSPKEPANDPNQTTGTGGSQETASMAPSASTIAFDPALLTIPGS